MELSISSNIKKVQRGMDKAARKQIPFAIAQTLTKLAYEAMQEEKAQTPRHIDRPTPFTAKGYRYKKANKKTLTALVYVDKADTERKYMQFPIHGGTAKGKRRALVHPTANTKLNKYGNIPRNYVKKAMANKAKFFSGVPKGMEGQDNAGIWQRYGGKKNPRIRMVAQWRKTRGYKAKFPFYEIAGKIVAGRANRVFNQQFERAMLNAK